MFHTGYSNLAGVNEDGERTTCEIHVQTFMTNLRCMQLNVDNDWNGNLHTWGIGLEQGIADVDL